MLNYVGEMKLKKQGLLEKQTMGKAETGENMKVDEERKGVEKEKVGTEKIGTEGEKVETEEGEKLETEEGEKVETEEVKGEVQETAE